MDRGSGFCWAHTKDRNSLVSFTVELAASLQHVSTDEGAASPPVACHPSPSRIGRRAPPVGIAPHFHISGKRFHFSLSSLLISQKVFISRLPKCQRASIILNFWLSRHLPPKQPLILYLFLSCLLAIISHSNRKYKNKACATDSGMAPDFALCLKIERPKPFSIF